MGAESTSRSLRAAWNNVHSSDEEARANLQSRLEVLSGLMFWSFVALLAFMYLMYAAYPDKEPEYEDVINYVSVVGLALLAIAWRGMLVRKKLSIEALNAIDAFYAIGTGLIFGLSAYLAQELRISATACLIYACFMVLLRTIIVPSTGARTAGTAILTFLPITVVAALVSKQQELPAPAYIGGELIICIVLIALATIGSRTLYGLRRQVSVAMQLGQYTLDRKIGEGGMGEVYRARHTLLRRPTAIKLLIPDRIGLGTLERFEREVQHMSQLTHPNTVQVFDYGRNPDGVFYYAMEYLDGIDLENLVEKYGRQPADRVIAILLQVCGALHEAHKNGIIHRDIKPANIILCERGAQPDIAKVVDFGLVKEITANNGESSRIILGTPAYIAPEAVTDPDTVGPAVDIYALGAVGYFLLTGKLVFEGKTSVDVCVQHVTADPIPPSQAGGLELPPALEELILTCLAKKPDQRPTAIDLARRLREVPAAKNWSEDDAQAWWAEFRKQEQDRSAVGTAPTLTITVDLGSRGNGASDGVSAILRQSSDGRLPVPTERIAEKKRKSDKLDA